MAVLMKKRAAALALAGLCSSVLIAGCGGGGGDGTAQDAASGGTAAQLDETASRRLPDPDPGTSPAPSPTPSPAPTPSPSPAPSPAPAPEPASPTASLPAASTCGLANFQQEIMKLINQARASSRSCGSTAYTAAPALKWNDKLFDAAAAHSTDMAANDYFSHTGQDGSSFSQRITAAGYAWKTAGENIAAGQNSIQQVMDGWLQSPGHCANIMNSAYTEVAVSCAYNAASTYQRYWTMELAAPR